MRGLLGECDVAVLQHSQQQRKMYDNVLQRGNMETLLYSLCRLYVYRQSDSIVVFKYLTFTAIHLA